MAKKVTTPSGLTDKQFRVFEFMGQFYSAYFHYPSVQEISREMELCDKGAMCHIVALIDKGFIQRFKEKGRPSYRITGIEDELRKAITPVIDKRVKQVKGG